MCNDNFEYEGLPVREWLLQAWEQLDMSQRTAVLARIEEMKGERGAESVKCEKLAEPQLSSQEIIDIRKMLMWWKGVGGA